MSGYLRPQPERGYIANKYFLIAVFLIIILGAVVYYGSLNGQFVLDDYYNIKYNGYIQSWPYLPALFLTDIGAKVAGATYSMYRPVQMLTYMLDYSLWKLNPVGYHLTNIILHILAALTICWLVNLLFNDRILSLLTASLFVIHPIHTEAVCYMSGRADPLALIFMMLTFIFYIKQKISDSDLLYTLMIASYSLALLSREGSFIVLALLVLYDYTFKEKPRLKGLLSLAGVTVLYFILRTAISGSLAYSSYGTVLLQRIQWAFAALASYVRLLLLPFNLHMEYGAQPGPFCGGAVLAGSVLLLLLATLALLARKNNKLVFFSISWFLITLVPVSNIYPINAYMAERWLYMPSIGFFLILAGSINSLLRDKRSFILGAVMLAALMLFYSHLTIEQNKYWKDPVEFYKKTLLYSPGNPVLLTNLGFEYIEKGMYDEAVSLYKKIIAAEPDNARAYNNLAVAYYQKKQYDMAIKYCDEAVKLGYAVRPGFLKALEPFRNK